MSNAKKKHRWLKPKIMWANGGMTYCQHVSTYDCVHPVFATPVDFDRMQRKVAKAMYAEFCRNEGHTCDWKGLFLFHRAKWMRYAYSALIAIGVPTDTRKPRKPTNPKSP